MDFQSDSLQDEESFHSYVVGDKVINKRITRPQDDIQESPRKVPQNLTEAVEIAPLGPTPFADNKPIKVKSPKKSVFPVFTAQKLAVVGIVLIVGVLVFASTKLRVQNEKSYKNSATVIHRIPSLRPSRTVATPHLLNYSTVIAAKIAKIAQEPALAPLSIEVADASSGDILWSQNRNMLLTPASTVKLLTASAALLALPPDHRIVTNVVAGDSPGTVVLVGNGDPTLSTLGHGQGFYHDAPLVSDLAQQILHNYQGNITKILVDESLFMGKNFAPTWMRADISDGDITPIVPTMVDGGRINPTYESPRVQDPGIFAGRALARALHLGRNVEIEIGVASPGSKVLATVHSAPLLERLRQTLLMSDNVMAEELSMEVAGATGNPLTFDGGIKAVHDTLVNSGIDLPAISLDDTNGLSHADRVSAHVLDNIILAATQEHATNKQLRILLNLLPVGGRTGTLVHRFRGANHQAGGYVRAKTGSMRGVNSLAGVVTTKEGQTLSFALVSNNTITSSDVICRQFDTIVTALYNAHLTR